MESMTRLLKAFADFHPGCLHRGGNDSFKRDPLEMLLEGNKIHAGAECR